MTRVAETEIRARRFSIRPPAKESDCESGALPAFPGPGDGPRLLNLLNAKAIRSRHPRRWTNFQAGHEQVRVSLTYDEGAKATVNEILVHGVTGSSGTHGRSAPSSRDSWPPAILSAHRSLKPNARFTDRAFRRF